MRAFLALTVSLPLVSNVGCSSGEVAANTDAAVDAATDGPRVSEAAADTYVAPLPPSLDCRFVDNDSTCENTYFLSNEQLYVCGHLATDDVYDAGIARPFPPPLGSPWNCSNVASPNLDAGPPSGQVGALWCCGLNPNLCVRATGLDGLCSQLEAEPAAFSCPNDDAGFPAGSQDGKKCLIAEVSDAGLTPPLAVDEIMYCCPGP
jgi:hypothetical protein